MLLRGQRERHCPPSSRGNHMNLGGPSSPGASDGLRAIPFRPGPVGMDIHDGAVQRECVDSDSGDFFFLERREYAVENAGLSPAVHPPADGVPTVGTLRQSAPLVPFFPRHTGSR